MGGKESQVSGKIRKDFYDLSLYIDNSTQNMIWRITMKDKSQIQVEVKDMPELHVVYIRHTGPYQGDSGLFEDLFSRLMRRAGPRSLLRFPETMMSSVLSLLDQSSSYTQTCVSLKSGVSFKRHRVRILCSGVLMVGQCQLYRL